MKNIRISTNVNISKDVSFPVGTTMGDVTVPPLVPGPVEGPDGVDLTTVRPTDPQSQGPRAVTVGYVSFFSVCHEQSCGT